MFDLVTELTLAESRLRLRPNPASNRNDAELKPKWSWSDCRECGSVFCVRAGKCFVCGKRKLGSGRRVSS